jgi:predicted aldo/keto reductase-like oxidoreductase
MVRSDHIWINTSKSKLEDEMKPKDRMKKETGHLTRRSFLGIGGMAIAGASLSSVVGCATPQAGEKTPEKPGIKETRILGRTGFAASDISMGCAQIKDSNLVRYAYDRGINYFDTAATYGNGLSETCIGKALPFMDRKKVFITTKLGLKDDDTKQRHLETFAKCQERLNTPYVDALLIAGATSTEQIKQKAFHDAVKQLKADGRLKYAGISCHGPRGMYGDSMEKVLLSGADDGRFDIFLLTYNFLNKEEAEKVLKACKTKNIATTAMKTTPGRIKEVPDFDPENPGEEYEGRVKMIMTIGRMNRERAIAMVKQMIAQEKVAREQTKPFLVKYGIKTEEQLWEASIKWVRANADMQTVCVSMSDFEKVDKSLALSGKNLSQKEEAFLRDYERAFSRSYCRHGCSQCSGSCLYAMPVSTIMRYAYYYEQGYEKHAMGKYAALKNGNSIACAGCDAPCEGSCPHGVMIQSNLLNAHAMLTLA